MAVYRNPAVVHYEFTPERVRSLYSLFSYGAEHASSCAEAIEYFDTRITYGELHSAVDTFAAGLVKLGVKKGDYVTIFLPNIPQCIIAVYSINRIGAISNLVHPLSTQAELKHCLTLTNSKYILAFEGNEGKTNGLDVKVIRCRIPEYFPKNPKGFVMKAAYNFTIRNEEKAAFATEWSDICLCYSENVQVCYSQNA